tara:strand:- start:473 stop:970 length:498 start_codon:yes stop_codon:yes gene_type:complete
MKLTNIVYEMDYVGIEANTIHNNIPYFFLFYELDSKNKEDLRVILDFFAKKRLAFLFYETKKGYHVVSPSLLELRRWDIMRKELKELNLNHYHNLAIRLDRKDGDSKNCVWSNWSHQYEYENSSSLLKIFELKFNCKLSCNDTVQTKLFYVKYSQTKIKDDILFN